MKNIQFNGNIRTIIVSIIGVISLLGFGACQNLIFDDNFERNGGIRLILQVVTDEALNQVLDQDARTIERELKDREIDFQSSKKGEGLFIKVNGIDSTGEGAARNYLNDTFGRNYDIRSSVTEGNTDFTVALRPTVVRNIRESTVHQAIETIKHRLDEFGVSNPRLRLSDVNDGEAQDQIIVEFPSVDDPDRVKNLLGKTAQFKLCLVHEKYSNQFSSIQDAMNTIGELPEDYLLLPYGNSDRNVSPQFILVQREAVITGKDLKNARRGKDQNGAPSVDFYLTADGADRFAKITSEHIGYRLAIVMDDRVYSAPEIRSKIGANGMITGNFTRYEAEDLVLLLRSGALPAPLRIIDEIYVPPVDR